jgi:hypothetical protein
MKLYKVLICLVILSLVGIPYADARTRSRFNPERFFGSDWFSWERPQRLPKRVQRTVPAPVPSVEIDAYGAPIRYQNSASKLPTIFAHVAKCESNSSHYDANGNVLHGRVDWDDIGKYQINQRYWGDEAYRLGHDIYTPAGNAAMALEIYNRQGLQPWSSSQWCWEQYL